MMAQIAGAALLLSAALMLAQNAAPPGSTINGTVPTAEGNVWNGLDHQPRRDDRAPANARPQARINHRLSKLDRQLLNDPLPRAPAGAPPVAGNRP
jgi:hypothetical protein